MKHTISKIVQVNNPAINNAVFSKYLQKYSFFEIVTWNFLYISFRLMLLLQRKSNLSAEDTAPVTQRDNEPVNRRFTH